jgi:hypothetical protein
MDELLSRALHAHGGLGNCAGLSGLTAEMSLAFAEVSGPDDLSRRLQEKFPEYSGTGRRITQVTADPAVRADAERTGRLLTHGTTTCVLVARLEGQ